jgi:hypothetical protein
VLGHLAGRLAQVEPGQQLSGPPPRGLLGQVEQLADHDQVLGPGEILVHRGELAGQADVLTYLVGLGADVEPVDPGGPRVRAQQGGENADRRGLARAVRAEQAEHGSFARREINPRQRLRVAKGFGQPRGLNR